MVAFIEEISRHNAIICTLLFSTGTGEVSIIPGITGQVKSLKQKFEDWYKLNRDLPIHCHCEKICSLKEGGSQLRHKPSEAEKTHFYNWDFLSVMVTHILHFMVRATPRGLPVCVQSVDMARRAAGLRSVMCDRRMRDIWCCSPGHTAPGDRCHMPAQWPHWSPGSDHSRTGHWAPHWSGYTQDLQTESAL